MNAQVASNRVTNMRRCENFGVSSRGREQRKETCGLKRWTARFPCKKVFETSFAAMTPSIKLQLLAIILLRNMPLTRDQPHVSVETSDSCGEVSGDRKSFS